MKRLQPLDALVAINTAGMTVSLVARPRGVTHLYAGPLTQTGMVPRRGRPLCNARTRRLYDRSSFPVRGELLVCVRCSARLVGSLPASPAEHPTPVPITSLADDRRRYRSLSAVDLYLSIRFAETEDELAECAVAMELGFAREELMAEHRSPTGRTFTDLPAVLEAARRRLRPRQPGEPGPYFRRPHQDPNYVAAIDHAKRYRHRPSRRTA